MEGGYKSAKEGGRDMAEGINLPCAASSIRGLLLHVEAEKVHSAENTFKDRAYVPLLLFTYFKLFIS